MLWMWIGLFTLVAVILFIDLGIVHRAGRELSLREATIWTLVWMGVGAGFTGAVYAAWQGGYEGQTGLTTNEAVLAYITTWVLELSLSLDNIFVMALIFKRWRIPSQHQHTVLFYGILGAVVFRTGMIVFGAQAVNRFEWLLPVFGLYLVYQGGKALYDHFRSDESKDIEKPLPTRYLGMPLVQPDHGGHFVLRDANGKIVVTTLLAALIAIEAADLLFAIDSVPAALSVTREEWIVIAANVLAIIGLRSLYSVLAGILERYYELHIALGMLLLFIGFKMIALPFFHLPNLVSLSVILTLLIGGFLGGYLRERREARTDAP